MPVIIEVHHIYEAAIGSRTTLWRSVKCRSFREVISLYKLLLYGSVPIS